MAPGLHAYVHDVCGDEDGSGDDGVCSLHGDFCVFYRRHGVLPAQVPTRTVESVHL